MGSLPVSQVAVLLVSLQVGLLANPHSNPRDSLLENRRVSLLVNRRVHQPAVHPLATLQPSLAHSPLESLLASLRPDPRVGLLVNPQGVLPVSP